MPHRFCRRYGLPDNKTYAYNTYTSEFAVRLAHAWADRMQYWYILFVAEEDDNYEFDAADRDSYLEPPDLQVALEGLVGKPRVEGEKRVHELRFLTPRRPVF